MASTRELEVSPDKSIADLGSDALWFAVHTLLAIFILGLVWAAITLARPDPASTSPKIFATALAFLVPMICGFIIVRMQRNPQHAEVACHIWISGLLLFAAVCVWVIGLPTGPGLCDTCGAFDKFWRTFFDLNQGSGLIDGDGLLVGVWAPLSLLGYAAGARLSLKG